MQAPNELSLLRSNDPLLIVAAPTTHDSLLAFSFLLSRYVAGLETHLTFAPSAVSRRISELVSSYGGSILIGLENNAPNLSLSGSSVLYITDSVDKYRIASSSNVQIREWMQAWSLTGIGDKIATLAVVGKILDDGPPHDALKRLQGIDRNVILSNVPASISISGNDAGLSLWPLVTGTTAVDGAPIEALQALLNSLPSGFSSAYLDYLLVPSPWLGGVNLAKLYLLAEARMVMNAAETEEGKMPRLPLRELMNVWSSPSVLGEETNKLVGQYVQEVRSLISKILSSISKARQYEFTVDDDLVLMHRACQVLSYLDRKYAVRLVARSKAAKIVCVPGNAKPPSDDRPFYRGARYLRMVEAL